jgi:acetyltransferase-like isoleucine patch superfamily enzyme
MEKPIYITGPVRFTLQSGSAFEMKAHSRIHSGYYANTFGGERLSIITVFNHGKLVIGSNAGISSTTIICTNQIIIGSNVLVGGGSCIYDTDFHEIEYARRDGSQVQSKPIEIKEGAFIGGYCHILKGVSIGKGSVVAAGSVVTKDIPDFEVWGGNPARFIKTINDGESNMGHPKMEAVHP